jgi:hypothetical protein
VYLLSEDKKVVAEASPQELLNDRELLVKLNLAESE